MKKNKTENLPIPLLTIIILTVGFVIAIKFYTQLDPSQIRKFGIYFHDSDQYRKITEQLYNLNFKNLEGMYPFAPRLLFPSMCAVLSNFFNISFIDSSYYLNLVCSFILVIFTFYLLYKNRIPKSFAIFISIIYLVFFLGSLRQTIVNPGSPFAFDSALICLFFFTLKNISRDKNEDLKNDGGARLAWKLINLVICSILIFLLTVGREFIFFILCIIIFSAHFKSFLPTIVKKIFINKKQLFIIYFFTFISGIGFGFTRYLVKDSSNLLSLKFIPTVIQFGWYHLNIAETFYVFFYSLGPLILSFILAITFSKTRKKLIQILFTTIDNFFFILVFCFSGVLFMFFGGTDGDRFLLWFFPFFALIGAKSFLVIYSSCRIKKRYLLAIFIIITLFWSRFYVPALPNIFFPGKFYNSHFGLRTNLSPNLFFGPNFLKNFILPLKKIPASESMQDIVIEKPSQFIKQELMISKHLERNPDPDKVAGSPFKGSYKYELNNIPIPFGFSHNHYEALVLHPYHGESRIKAILLLQWAFMYLMLFFFIKNIIKK